MDDLDPTLQNIIAQDSLKWIFVGGKGGVGKTTTSCCIAVQLAKVRKNVLIVSTDPAHNLSDAFGQKFGSTPLLVNGFDNLFCLEVDASSESTELREAGEGNSMFGDMDGGLGATLQELLKSLPGIDESMAFGELMKMVQEMDFETVIFDTAPTGHTLRLLSFPQAMETALTKILELKNRFAGMLNQMRMLIGEEGMQQMDMMIEKIEHLKSLAERVHNQLCDAEKTTFVCVCIPEFLSIYETERLVQELTKSDIDTHNVVVNQVVFPDKDVKELREWYDGARDSLPTEARELIEKSLARKRMQDRYISQIFELYEDFHVVLMPLLDSEVRGVAALESFSQLLLQDSTKNSF